MTPPPPPPRKLDLFDFGLITFSILVIPYWIQFIRADLPIPPTYELILDASAVLFITYLSYICLRLIYLLWQGHRLRRLHQDIQRARRAGHTHSRLL